MINKMKYHGWLCSTLNTDCVDGFRERRRVKRTTIERAGNGEEIQGVAGNVSSTYSSIKVRVFREVDCAEITFLPRERLIGSTPYLPPCGLQWEVRPCRRFVKQSIPHTREIPRRCSPSQAQLLTSEFIYTYHMYSLEDIMIKICYIFLRDWIKKKKKTVSYNRLCRKSWFIL